jgi:hypothetical protein
MINYTLKRKVIEKLRIIYRNGYIHEFWVYNLKINKTGEYTWTTYKESNRLIDLQPNEIISIFVIKRKKVFYWSKKRIYKPKPKLIVLDIFKPRPLQSIPVTTKKEIDTLKVSDDITIEITKQKNIQYDGYI